MYYCTLYGIPAPASTAAIVRDRSKPAGWININCIPKRSGAGLYGVACWGLAMGSSSLPRLDKFVWKVLLEADLQPVSCMKWLASLLSHFLGRFLMSLDMEKTCVTKLPASGWYLGVTQVLKHLTMWHNELCAFLAISYSYYKFKRKLRLNCSLIR